MKKIKMLISEIQTSLNEAKNQNKLVSQSLEDLKKRLSLLNIQDQELEEGVNNIKEQGTKTRFELDGETDFIGRLALKATEKLAETKSFEEMKQIVRQEYVMPKRGKLIMWVLADEVNERTSDPNQRYFIDHPITTKDGKVIYCTTQWAARELNRKEGKYVDGAFIRFAQELVKAGIFIRKAS